MHSNKSILALIVARGGSKRLPGKNVKDIGGKPMIAWSVEAAKQSKYVDRLIISTDDDEVASICRRYGAEIPFERPAELASDTADSVDVALHALGWLKNEERYECDYLLLLQPTSPLRTTGHIDEAIERLIGSDKFESLISVYEWGKKPGWMYTFNSEGYLESCLEIKSDFGTPEKFLMPNGAIYLIKTEVFLKQKTFNSKRMGGYLMKFIDSVDIDTAEDFELAEILIKQR